MFLVVPTTESHSNNVHKCVHVIHTIRFQYRSVHILQCTFVGLHMYEETRQLKTTIYYSSHVLVLIAASSIDQSVGLFTQLATQHEQMARMVDSGIHRIFFLSSSNPKTPPKCRVPMDPGNCNCNCIHSTCYGSQPKHATRRNTIDRMWSFLVRRLFLAY